jgi:hypothetical protein
VWMSSGWKWPCCGVSSGYIRRGGVYLRSGSCVLGGLCFIWLRVGQTVVGCLWWCFLDKYLASGVRPYECIIPRAIPWQAGLRTHLSIRPWSFGLALLLFHQPSHMHYHAPSHTPDRDDSLVNRACCTAGHLLPPTRSRSANAMEKGGVPRLPSISNLQ